MERETRLILLASLQVIPNVVSTLHYWKNGGLAAVHILYTEDERNSRGPATRLKKLFEELRAEALFDNRAAVTVRLDDRPVGIEPQEVRSRIEEIMGVDPDARWVVNVTGGLKLMAFGGLGLPMPHPLIVYLERGKGWFVLDSDTRGAVVAWKDPELPGDSGSPIDDIPIASLVRTQFVNGDRFTFSDKGRPPALDVSQFVRRGVETKWDWRALSNPGEQSGFAFERLIGAAVLRMGIQNVVWSLKIGELHEMDVVLCHRGIVSLLDLKLMPSAEQGRHAQIREAAEAGSGIGGVDRRVIMIRPNWDASDETRALANAHNVVLIAQDQAASLFSTLAKLIGGKPDGNLCEAEKILEEGKAGLGFALATTSPEQELLMTSNETRILDLDTAFNLHCLRYNQNWMLLADGPELVLRVRTPAEDVETINWQEIFDRAKQPFTEAIPNISTSRKTFRLRWAAAIPRTSGGRAAVASAVTSVQGRHINLESMAIHYKL